MKSMITKKTVVLLILVIAVFVISCSGGAVRQPVVEGDTIFERMQKTTYQVRFLFPGWDFQPDKDMVVKAFNDKLTELGYPGLSIRLEGMDWGSWSERGNAVVLSGGDYDIVYTPTWVSFYSDAIAGGAWAPWEKHVEEFPEFKKLVEPWLDSMYEWGNNPNQMHIYRMPNIKEYASILSEARWNKTVADKLGITEGLRNVKTPHDLEPFLEIYKNAYGTNGMAVLAVDSSALENSFKLAGSVFSPAYDPDTDRYETGVFQPWFDEYINLRRDWYSKGYITDYQQTEVWDDLVRKFGPESFLVYFNVGKPGGEAESNVSAMQVLGFEWGMTFLAPPFIDIDRLMGVCFAINARSRNIEATAFMHMLLNTNKELTNLINFGIEGVHYNLDETGTLIRKEPSRYFPNLMWMLGNRFLCYPLPGEPENLGEIYNEFNNSAITFPNFGFAPPDVNTFIKAGVDMDLFRGVTGALATQYGRSIEIGTLSDSDITDIKNRLIQGNYRGIEEVFNKEYQAWKAAREEKHE